MSHIRYTPEFKDEAVDRGHSVSEVAERLGVSAHSLYDSPRTHRRQFYLNHAACVPQGVDNTRT